MWSDPHVPILIFLFYWTRSLNILNSCSCSRSNYTTVVGWKSGPWLPLTPSQRLIFWVIVFYRFSAEKNFCFTWEFFLPSVIVSWPGPVAKRQVQMVIFLTVCLGWCHDNIQWLSYNMQLNIPTVKLQMCNKVLLGSRDILHCVQ